MGETKKDSSEEGVISLAGALFTAGKDNRANLLAVPRSRMTQTKARLGQLEATPKKKESKHC